MGFVQRGRRVRKGVTLKQHLHVLAEGEEASHEGVHIERVRRKARHGQRCGCRLTAGRLLASAPRRALRAGARLLLRLELRLQLIHLLAQPRLLVDLVAAARQHLFEEGRFEFGGVLKSVDLESERGAQLIHHERALELGHFLDEELRWKARGNVTPIKLASLEKVVRRENLGELRHSAAGLHALIRLVSVLVHLRCGYTHTAEVRQLRSFGCVQPAALEAVNAAASTNGLSHVPARRLARGDSFVLYAKATEGREGLANGPPRVIVIA